MSYKSEGTFIIESGNNIKGLRSIRFDLGIHPGKDGVIRFPDNWDIAADFSTVDRVEFWLSHKDLTNVNTSGIEFRVKTGGNKYYKVLLDMQTTNWIEHFFGPSDFTVVNSPTWANINCVEFYIPHSGGVLTFSDNFDDGDLSGWSLHQVGGTVTPSTEESVSGLYSMKIYDNNNDEYVYASRAIGAQTGIIYVDIAIKPTWVSGESVGSIRTKNNAGTLDIASVEFAANRFIWVADGGLGNMVTTNVPWKLGEWHFIRIKMNTSTQTYDVYIDNFATPVATGLDFRDSATDFGTLEITSRNVSTDSKNLSIFYVDEVYIGKNPIMGILQIDGLVFRKREVSATAYNMESMKIYGTRDLPLLDKDIIDKDTAQELVNTILHYSQYPTIRTTTSMPLVRGDLLGKSVYVESKGMKWLLPIFRVSSKITPQKENTSLNLGRRAPSVEEILATFGIEQGRIKVGGSGIDWGNVVEQFEKACFQTCQVTCMECGYGAVCESSCQKTGCLTLCEISLCMTNCQSIKDRYENWCSGSACQTCAESGPIV